MLWWRYVPGLRIGLRMLIVNLLRRCCLGKLRLDLNLLMLGDGRLELFRLRQLHNLRLLLRC